MKKLLFLFLFSTFTFFANGQTWAPVGAKWYYNHFPGAQPFLTVIESVGDTTINSKQCKILKTYEIVKAMDSTFQYHWDTINCPIQYTFLESGIVYFYDLSKNDFNKLYNFNAAKGDTITVNDSIFAGYCPNAYTSNLFQYVLDSIYDTIIGGITLHKEIISKTANSDWLFSDPSGIIGNMPIIERIGSTKYLFGVTMNIVMEGPINCLRCYVDSELSYHAAFWNDTVPCGHLPDLNTGINENNENGIKVFPNPALNQVNIQIENSVNQSYYIYNSIGQLVLTSKINNTLTTIDLGNLNAGIYYLIIRPNYNFATKFIIRK